MKTRRSMVALMAAAAGTTGALAQTATWNGASADWDTNNWNWSPNGAGFPDSVLIDAVQNNGNLNLRAATAFAVRDFTINGGNLTGSGSLTIAGAFNLAGGTAAGNLLINGLGGTWSGGSMNNAGSTAIGATGSWTITAGAADFAGHTIGNSGTIRHSAGTVRGGGSSVVNSGLWDEDGAVDTALNMAYGGWVFSNEASGVLRRSGAATTTFAVVLNNSGLVEATTGTMNLTGGGTAFDGSRFRATGGGQVNFAGSYTFSGASTFEGDGAVRITGGTMSGDHTILGTSLEWTGGNFNSGFTSTVASGAKLTVSAGTADFASHAFVNEGTIEHAAGTLRGGGGGSGVLNKALWLETGAMDTVINAAYGAWTFNNASSGTFRKDSPADTTISAAFSNAGLAEAVNGTLRLTGGGTASEGSRFRATGTGTIVFGNNYAFSGNVNFEGDSTVLISGGTMFGDHTFNGTNLRWIGGNFNSAGTTTIAPGSAFEIASGPSDFAGRTLVNNGVVKRTAGDLRGSGAGGVVNHGVWEESNAANSSINSAYGGSMVFANAVDGELRKLSGSTTSFNGGAALNNAGLVDVQAGLLTVDSGGMSVDGARFRATGAGLINFGSYEFSGNVYFEGDSKVRIVAGTQFGSQTYRGTNIQWLGGNFNSAGTTTIASGSAFEIASGPSDFAGRTFVNNGTVNRTAGDLRGSGSSSVSNHGVWNELNPGDSSINSAYGGTYSFTNEADGVFRKTSASNTYFSGAANLVNIGLVDVQSGVLHVNGGGQSVDGARFRATGGGVINFSSYQFNDDVQFEGDGAVNLASGTFFGNHTFHGTNLNWTGGNYNNPGTTIIGTDGRLRIVTGAADMAGRTFRNDGEVLHGSGQLRGNSSSDVINAGLWVEASAANTSINSAFGGSWTFHNAAEGIFRKAGSGTDATFSSVAMENAGLIDIQDGSVTFNAGFHQSGGRTQVNNATIFSSTPLIFDGGELGGNGMVNQSVVMNGGWLTPGLSPGVLTIAGALTFAEPAALMIELDGKSRGLEYDAVDVGGAVTLGNSMLYAYVGLNGLATIEVGDVFEILTRQGANSIVGTFKDLPEGATLIAGQAFEVKISYVGGSGNDITLTVTNVVPAPGVAAMAIGGLVGLRRRRR
jgi:fibronectin-binding autotransporter adhesin